MDNNHNKKEEKKRLVTHLKTNEHKCNEKQLKEERVVKIVEMFMNEVLFFVYVLVAVVDTQYIMLFSLFFQYQQQQSKHDD